LRRWPVTDIGSTVGRMSPPDRGKSARCVCRAPRSTCRAPGPRCARSAIRQARVSSARSTCPSARSACRLSRQGPSLPKPRRQVQTVRQAHRQVRETWGTSARSRRFDRHAARCAKVRDAPGRDAPGPGLTGTGRTAGLIGPDARRLDSLSTFEPRQSSARMERSAESGRSAGWPWRYGREGSSPACARRRQRAASGPWRDDGRDGHRGRAVGLASLPSRKRGLAAERPWLDRLDA
jgi:hypothetical protein